jgi:effector-binding domain-containing protein
MKLPLKTICLAILFICNTGFVSNSLPLSRSNENHKVSDSVNGTTLEKIQNSELIFLSIRDTAYGQTDFERKSAKNKGDLFMFTGQNNIKTGKLLVFYQSKKLPMIFETAVEVEKLPAGSSKKIQSKVITPGEMIVAHYKGSYSNIATAYGAINKWLKENNKEAKDLAYEIYRSDPFTLTNDNQLMMDIYQPIK